MYVKNIAEMKKDDILVVSLAYWLENKEELKGTQLAITPDGEYPKDVEDVPIEETSAIVNQPTEEPIEARVEKLELEQEQVIDLLAQALGV